MNQLGRWIRVLVEEIARWTGSAVLRAEARGATVNGGAKMHPEAVTGRELDGSRAGRAEDTGWPDRTEEGALRAGGGGARGGIICRRGVSRVSRASRASRVCPMRGALTMEGSDQRDATASSGGRPQLCGGGAVRVDMTGGGGGGCRAACASGWPRDRRAR